MLFTYEAREGQLYYNPDLTQGYWLVFVSKEDHRKTTFAKSKSKCRFFTKLTFGAVGFCEQIRELVLELIYIFM